MFAEVICQDHTVLRIHVLEDVQAAQPLVARDPGIARTICIPLRENFLWVHTSGNTDFLYFF